MEHEISIENFFPIPKPDFTSLNTNDKIAIVLHPYRQVSRIWGCNVFAMSPLSPAVHKRHRGNVSRRIRNSRLYLARFQRLRTSANKS